MCEFTVFKKGKVVFKNAVYAKSGGNKVTSNRYRDSLKTFRSRTIKEVNVQSERLVLQTLTG